MTVPHRLVEGTATVEDVDAFVADLGEVGDAHGCTLQAFDARYVVDAAHLRRALELADRAIERGENVARDRAVEVLLYAAGRRQIDRALAMGVSEGRGPVIVLVAAVSDADAERSPSDRVDAAAAAVGELLEPEETLGAYEPDLVADFFEVTDAERAATDAALPELVRERVALLDVEK